MIQVFRKAWYHTVGFGTANRMYTVINAFDPREIEGAIDYRPPTVNGEEPDLEEFSGSLRAIAEMIMKASAERDREKEARGSLEP